MSEPDTVNSVEKSKSHSSKTEKSHYVGIRFPNALFEKLQHFPEKKTEIILKAFEQFCDNSGSSSPLDIQLLHFLITQFIELGLKIVFPSDLKTRLLEIIKQLQQEGKL